MKQKFKQKIDKLRSCDVERRGDLNKICEGFNTLLNFLVLVSPIQVQYCSFNIGISYRLVVGFNTFFCNTYCFTIMSNRKLEIKSGQESENRKAGRKERKFQAHPTKLPTLDQRSSLGLLNAQEKKERREEKREKKERREGKTHCST